MDVQISVRYNVSVQVFEMLEDSHFGSCEQRIEGVDFWLFGKTTSSVLLELRSFNTFRLLIVTINGYLTVYGLIVG